MRSRRPGRWRAWLAGLALLALAAAAVPHFQAHPEDLALWRRVGGEGLRRLAAFAAPAPPEPARAEPVPSPEPGPTVAAAPTEAPPPPEPSPSEPSPPEPSPPEPLPPDISSPDASGAGSAGAAGQPTPSDLQAPPTPPEPMPEPVPLAAGPALAEPTPAAAPAREKPAPSGKDPSLPRPESPEGRAQGPRATAWLSIGFEHRLESGTLEVWVDGKPVAKEALDSRVTRKLLGFALRAGSVQQTLALEPGRHEVRVRVRSEDDVKTARSSATFPAGRTRRLEVKAPRLRGSLTLEWK